ncbi:MAG TPA: MarR family transcriptional regulator [Anaerolineae bacterium]|nr:MarR family transcriptional regulator [Anaerolineae bacterium]HNU03229.1 MarR family transcriptional regulator [Anaerolineae bacterium]
MTGLNLQNTSTPAGQILEFLLRNGPASIKELEEVTGVTATAVRQQLASLTTEGLVTMSKEKQGVGRPRNLYQLTERSHSLFAYYSDELALDLIGELLETEGTDKLRYLLNRVGAKLAAQYRRQIKGEAMGDRMRELSLLLDRRGIRVDLEHDAGVFVLREYNCPYHGLASVHRDVCEMERNAFSMALDADVILGDCIQDGHNSCQFFVSSRANRPAASLAPRREPA